MMANLKLVFSLLCIGIIFFRDASAQIFTDSNLPIVIIKTDNGVSIPDIPRVLARMIIISRKNGERNYLTDQNNPAFLDYDGRINIEVRGSSSQYPDKKQYGFSTLLDDNVTENNVTLLGLPKENDWILNSMVFDTALIRDYLSYNLSRQIGEYASRTVYCEVVINSYYKGLYLLQEKIKADANRVNVHKILPSDNLPPEVTGGYITKADKTTGGDPVAWQMQADYIHVLPKPEEVTPAQSTYIHDQFLTLATTSRNGNSSVTDGFPHYVDMPSFIDYMIIQELSSNCDAYQFSTYFHKDRKGKLRAGPLWDNDLTYGNDLFLWGYDRSHTNVWQFSNGDNEGSAFWKDLFNNSVFRCYLARRWNELIQPGMPLNLASMEAFIDQTVNTITEAAIRNNTQWGIITNFQDRINFIKAFLRERIDWMTANLGSFTACSNVPVPPLVISKIMYNPPVTALYPKSNDQEFLEITNNGDITVNLTGIYFAGTGFVYQFPNNSVISPHASVFLANNISVFKEKYGFTPFGQFTRNLSDEGQDLILADGYGNVIDNVWYTDTIPWPAADGNGYYLKLTDPDLDNSISSNWTASNDRLFDDKNIPENLTLVLYP
ncbi:MAG: CotH kinase family protein, partial [Bacteroidota bacterium]|nr:CotH kinase family protein [Bacteroidota bacterium]